MSYEKFLERYGQCEVDGPDLRQWPEEFTDWKLTVPFADGAMEILCCPEDRRCEKPGCCDGSVVCDTCEVPLCLSCANCLLQLKPKMPPASLAKDMMIFYAPRELYTEKVTVMELLCASVCLNSMICFTMEVKYGRMEVKHGRLFDMQVHMQRHRLGARGNATTFPLPWQLMMKYLQELDATDAGGSVPDLPRSGKELSEYVHVLLKSNDSHHEDETGSAKKKSLEHFIYQARVRRKVVVQLILGSKARGVRG